MKFKALINLMPLVAIALVVGILWQQRQASEAARRPDYDDAAAASPAPGLLPRPQSELATVINVHDRDTITVKLGWQKVKVRLCRIDAPEVAHGHGLGQPLGEEAKETLRSLLQAAGKQVIVVPLEQDRYGRTVGEVFVKAPTRAQPEQERFINYEMVTAGMAYEYTRYAGSCPNRAAIAKGEAEAKEQHRGVWLNPNAMKPWDYRKLSR